MQSGLQFIALLRGFLSLLTRPNYLTVDLVVFDMEGTQRLAREMRRVRQEYCGGMSFKNTSSSTHTRTMAQSVLVGTGILFLALSLASEATCSAALRIL